MDTYFAQEGLTSFPCMAVELLLPKIGFWLEASTVVGTWFELVAGDTILEMFMLVWLFWNLKG